MTLEEFLEEWHSPSPTVLLHTSGSTGRPKPFLMEKERMKASAHRTCDFLSLSPGDTALLCLPLEYIAGKMVVVRALERNMTLLTVTPSRNPLREIIERCETEGVDPLSVEIAFAAMVPSQVLCSLNDDRERQLLQRIRHIIIGGGVVSRELSTSLERFPNSIWSTYGMTETASHIALRRLNGEHRSEWYEPFPSVSVSLYPDSMVPDGCGLLVIDAPEVCGERLVTNDICELHPDGRRFRVLGRRDNVICSGGIKLQIEEIEDALSAVLSLPFCITKCSDALYGEVAVLLVEHSEPNDDSLSQLLSSALAVLPRYSKPKKIFCCTTIPLTSTGKINRAACKALVANPKALHNIEGF